MPRTCCAVPLCSTKGGHEFPWDLQMRIRWINAIRRPEDKNGQPWVPSISSVICHNHFLASDYLNTTLTGHVRLRRKLKKDAVPSQFSWNKTSSETSTAQSVHSPAQSAINSHPGTPADDEDVDHVDWIPTLKMGHSTDIYDDDSEDMKSRWPNWEMFVKRILVFLKSGAHDEELTRSEQKAIQKAAKTYYLEGGVLFHQRSKKPLRVVMLESEHRDVIRQFHVKETGIHSGINATVDRITSKFFWRGIKQDVVQFISQCCGKNKESTKVPAAMSQNEESQPDAVQPNVLIRSTTNTIQKNPSIVLLHSSEMSASKMSSVEESAMRLLEEYSLHLRTDMNRGDPKQSQNLNPCNQNDSVLSVPQGRPDDDDDDVIILDETTGDRVRVDRKHSSEKKLGPSTPLGNPLCGFGVSSNSVIKNKGFSDSSATFSKDGVPNNMTASATILKLIDTASKEKAEHHGGKSSNGRPKTKPIKPDLFILPKPVVQIAAAKSQTAPEGDAQGSTKHYRNFAWSLHNIGLRLVRQQVYKNLVEIQEIKNDQNRLDEGEKRQLDKLKGYYMDLRQKNRYLMGRGRRCRCGYRVGSMQELDLHQEYGHGWESSRYDCCLCKFTSKAFSIFSSHMAKEHHRKARFHLPLAPFVCPYCPFEHRHNTKKKLLRHIANCDRNFQLDFNLAVRAIDTDIPLLAPPKPTAAPASTDSETTGPAATKIQDTASPSAARNQRSAKSGVESAASGQSSSTGRLHLKPMVPRYEVCEICGGFVKDRGSLIIHMKVAHKVDVHLMCKNNPNAPIKCGSCPERFWTLQSLNVHMSLSHGETKDASQALNISVCPLCKRTRLTDVMSHLAQQHRVTLLDMFLVRYCALCLLELHSEKAFEDHMTTCHLSLYPSRGALFESIRSLEQQRLSNSCRPSALLLALVNRKHPWKFNASSRNLMQMFSCPLCRCQFGSLDDLTSHFEQVHSHKCHQCEYRCGSAELLSRHFRRDHDSMERCPICETEIAAGGAMVAHFEEHHLMKCSINLKRASVSSEIDTKNDIGGFPSSVNKRRPSSLSDESNADSVYDEEQDENEQPPMAKRARVDTIDMQSGGDI